MCQQESLHHPVDAGAPHCLLHRFTAFGASIGAAPPLHEARRAEVVTTRNHGQAPEERLGADAATEVILQSPRHGDVLWGRRPRLDIHTSAPGTACVVKQQETHLRASPHEARRQHQNLITQSQRRAAASPDLATIHPSAVAGLVHKLECHLAAPRSTHPESEVHLRDACVCDDHGVDGASTATHPHCTHGRGGPRKLGKQMQRSPNEVEVRSGRRVQGHKRQHWLFSAARICNANTLPLTLRTLYQDGCVWQHLFPFLKPWQDGRVGFLHGLPLQLLNVWHGLHVQLAGGVGHPLTQEVLYDGGFSVNGEAHELFIV
mmetsp:Transcript_13947/g.32731  ORF Transcript_13947/g.32731 Transcript_13947/m.32731 type:complete len:318 (-) Transcript_13947:66-1019(-)